MNFCWAKVVSISMREFVCDYLVEECLDCLEVGHVAGSTDHGGGPDWMKTSDVLESGERAIRSCALSVSRQRGGGERIHAPRLSAAIIIPSLN